MMNRFSPKYGAITLVSLGALYLIISLVSGHSAASEPPPDLSRADAAIDNWRAAGMLLSSSDACVIDTRASEAFELYHLPRSKRVPPDGASIVEACPAPQPLLIIAAADEQAAKLAGAVAKVRGDETDSDVHFLTGGASSWYLTFELPVPLFSAKPPPYGYTEAMAQVRAWLADGSSPSKRDIDDSLGVLIRADYQPTAIGSKKKKAPAGKKKKISGGCG